ncbi:MAG: twitching motility protein PilJ [Pseudomonadota bacterium]|nr:twitching motility protein PilJ [Pseudomonadota bacterium]
MGNQNIRVRLTLLIVVQLVFLILVGVIGYLGMNRIGGSVSQVSAITATQANLGALTEAVRNDLLGLVNRLMRGSTTWEDAEAAFPQAADEVDRNWQRYLEGLTFRPQGVEANIEIVRTVNAELTTLIEQRDRARLNLFVANDLDEMMNPFFKSMLVSTTQVAEQSSHALAEAQRTGQQFQSLIAILAVVGLFSSALIGLAIYRSIVRPVNRIAETVHQVNAGDYIARTELQGSDELGQLGRAFDQLLNERVAALVGAEQENDRLNDSVINLLQAVSQLSQRDLTIKAQVTEDITGPVADALNLLTEETARVLQRVIEISEQVASASDMVKAQSATVIAVADHERLAVGQTAVDLATAAEAMQQIAHLAQNCNTTAETAIQTTQAALETVTSTVDGINGTRDTIRETEKRIKRLGERSQEITGVVNLINTIAERTHILALNASMHAASAGEAGRGFAVVADEVQRLAENAREATSRIATLVSNIQIETADTVTAINTAISQVVDGSRLAEQAGDQMKRTQHTTAELVAAVRQIADQSRDQAQLSHELLGRAAQIQDSTQQTRQQLEEQNVQTNQLVEFAQGLLSSVRVFRLPA